MAPVQNVPQPHRDKLGLLKELVHTSIVSQRILKTASNLAEGFNVGAVNVESHLALPTPRMLARPGRQPALRSCLQCQAFSLAAQRHGRDAQLGMRPSQHDLFGLQSAASLEKSDFFAHGKNNAAVGVKQWTGL